jgi:hypothetical protein
MPNWCNNSLTISHDDPAMIARARQAIKDDRLLSEFIPVPQDLVDTVAGFSSGDEQRKLDEQIAKNLETYGFKDWYEFCVNQWGTKWDINGGEITGESDTCLTMYFDTAWSPPIEAYRKLDELGFNIEAMYYESGMGFCGEYTTRHGDDSMTIIGDSTWVEANVPSNINEAFNISENMAEWEEENEDDEDESEELIDKVIARIKTDIAVGDMTAIAELLSFIPEENLKGFLSEVDN